MPESVSTRSAYKMLTCIYLCRTLLFFAPYADFFMKKQINVFLYKEQEEVIVVFQVLSEFLVGYFL